MMGSLLLIALAATTQAPAAAAAAPKPFKSTSEGFVVTFPARPTERKKGHTIGDDKVDLSLFSIRRGSTSFSVMSGELETLPAEDPGQVLDFIRDGFATDVKGKVAEEKPLTVGGHQGREIRVEIPRKVMANGGVARARIFLVDRHVYELSTIQPATRSELDSAEVDGFFASFKLLGKPKLAEASEEKTSQPAAKKKSDTAKKPAKKSSKEKGKGKEKDKAAIDPLYGWQEFRPDEGGVSIRVPVKPEPMDMGGQQLHFKLYIAMQWDIGYSLAALDLPSEDNETLDVRSKLDVLKAAMVASFKGTVVSDRRVVVQGYPGMDLTIDLPAQFKGPLAAGGTWKARLMLIDKRVYQAVVMIPKGTDAPADAQPFLESLKPDQPAPPEIAKAAEAAAAETAGDKTPAVAITRPKGALKGTWQRINHSEGGFSAVFPAVPTTTEKNVPTPAGPRPIKGLVLNQDLRQFLVLYDDETLPGEFGEIFEKNLAARALEPMFDKGERDLMSPFQSPKIVSKRRITVDGYPGRDTIIEFEGPANSGRWQYRVRLIVVGLRLYTVSWRGQVAGMSEADVALFLDSFQPKPKPAGDAPGTSGSK